MTKSELVNALANFEDDYEVRIILDDDPRVYNDIINVEADGVNAVEITVA